MNVLSRALLLAVVLIASATINAQSTNPSGPGGVPASETSRPAAYDCFGMEGVPLISCLELNSEAASPDNTYDNSNTITSPSHDCGGMTSTALASCLELNNGAANPGNTYDNSNTITSPSHDCGGMSGTAFATCGELNRQPAHNLGKELPPNGANTIPFGISTGGMLAMTAG